MAAAVRSNPCSRSAPRKAGMQDQIFRTQSKRPLHFAPECLHRLLQKNFIRTREIHQVIGVNHQRLQIVGGSQAVHLGTLRLTKFIGRPLPWAGGENLKRIAAQAVSPLGRILHASGRGRMNANAARSQAGRAFRPWRLENVLFTRHGASHGKSITTRFALLAGRGKGPSHKSHLIHRDHRPESHFPVGNAIVGLADFVEPVGFGDHLHSAFRGIVQRFI